MIDFLGIGAQKAGTSWLVKNLKHHPKIWMPRFAKELHFFDVLYLGTDRQHRLNNIRKRCEGIIDNSIHRHEKSIAEKEASLKKMFDPNFAFTDEWYSHIFLKASSIKLKGEYTPLYCALNSDGISHVKRLMPNVKIIYIIRDPIDRTLSSLRMELEFGKGKQQNILRNPLFLARGNYANNIPAWEHEFPVKQILYLPFGRIKTEPLSVLRDVENFLGLIPFDAYPSLKEKVNQTGIKKKNIEILPESRQFIEEISRTQYDFLTRRFGEAFVFDIK